jgi:Flp pilus assembly protein CpaB
MPGCCGIASRKNTAAFVVMALALAVGAIYFVREGIRKPPPVETVEVVVAAKDMPTGTAFTKENVDGYVTTQRIPKADLPHNLVTLREQLIRKRLTRATHKGEFFTVSDLNPQTLVAIGPGQEFKWLPFIPRTSESVLPGSRLDVVASYGKGPERVVFTLLPDLTALALNGVSWMADSNTPPGTVMVWFAVDERQAKLITLANQANCNLELVLRHPDAPKREFDYDATLTRVKALLEKQVHVAPSPREVGER